MTKVWDKSQKAATVDDVAKLAGVSKATAARVLGRYGSSSVRTRAAVHAAAATLNYRPNGSSRGLDGAKSQSIGVISRNVANPGFAVALEGIMAVGSGAGASVVVAGSEFDSDLEKAAVELLLDKQVDALIVSPANGTVIEHLQSAHHAGVPIILWERRLSGLDLPIVAPDMAGAGRVVGRHLMGLGHKRVGYVATYPHPRPYQLGDDIGASVITDRLEGIYGTYSEAGLRPSTDLVRFASRTSAAIQRAVIELLDHDDSPTALVASDAQIGLEMMTAIRARGLSIPHDVSMIMFEGAPWATLVDPPLTVVVQPTYDMGRTAAEVALASIGSEFVPRIPLFPAELVLRDSVGPARG